MYNYETRKLNIQLVPSTSWYSNLRSILPNWSEISYLVRKPCKCDICGKIGELNDFDAHEVWKYEHNMQSLDKIICVCKDCHACIHMGHTLIEGDSKKAKQHYMRVNNISLEECENDIEDAFDVWEVRSRLDWFINEPKLIKQVEETYNISCDLSKPIDNKYYANIPYKLKEKAKSFGAKWDNNRKLWYFTSDMAREKWYKQNN